LPYITTVNNQFLYDCPANVWKVGAILVDATGTYDYGWTVISTTYDESLALENFRIGGKAYYRVRNIRSWPARIQQVAQFQFVDINPGDNTEVFRRLAYSRPMEIVSDAVQHQMPIGTEHILLEATVQFIRAIAEPAKFEKVRLYIETKLKPLVTNALGRGEQGQSSYSVRRAF